MEDLIGLLIFLIIFGSRITERFGKRLPKEEDVPPETQHNPGKPKRQTLTGWLEELERQMYPKEEPRPVSATPEPVVQVSAPVKTAFPVNPPEPERTSITSTSLREPSDVAEELFGPTDLQRAVIMSEILGPPRCKQKRSPFGR